MVYVGSTATQARFPLETLLAAGNARSGNNAGSIRFEGRRPPNRLFDEPKILGKEALRGADHNVLQMKSV